MKFILHWISHYTKPYGKNVIFFVAHQIKQLLENGIILWIGDRIILHIFHAYKKSNKIYAENKSITF